MPGEGWILTLKDVGDGPKGKTKTMGGWNKISNIARTAEKTRKGLTRGGREGQYKRMRKQLWLRRIGSEEKHVTEAQDSELECKFEGQKISMKITEVVLSRPVGKLGGQQRKLE